VLLLVGKYMMIVGELIQTGLQPVVHAIKIQDLSQDAILQKIWNLEIEDSRRCTQQELKKALELQL